MSSSTTGECFVVLPPYSSSGTVIFGRNAIDANSLNVSQEVMFYEAMESIADQCNEGVTPELGDTTLRVILQKPCPHVWGGDFGANERNVVCGLMWSITPLEDNKSSLRETDYVRYVLGSSSTAAEAVDRIGALVEAYGYDDGKFSFIVCDSTEAWSVSCAGKLWAAQRYTEGYHRFPSNGLSVRKTIDKSSDGLGDALKTLGFWNGEDEIDFATCLGATCDSDLIWSGTVPSSDGSFVVSNMFETIRSSATPDSSRSATVSVVTTNGISCHWFTATPNAHESVFKPFIFAPNPKLSPLTKLPDNNDVCTLLYKLHAQRKKTAIENLKALECSCVEEINNYLDEHSVPDDELDELLKDCVEAEVKFYR